MNLSIQAQTVLLFAWTVAFVTAVRKNRFDIAFEIDRRDPGAGILGLVIGCENSNRGQTGQESKKGGATPLGRRPSQFRWQSQTAHLLVSQHKIASGDAEGLDCDRLSDGSALNFEEAAASGDGHGDGLG